MALALRSLQPQLVQLCSECTKITRFSAIAAAISSAPLQDRTILRPQGARILASQKRCDLKTRKRCDFCSVPQKIAAIFLRFSRRFSGDFSVIYTVKLAILHFAIWKRSDFSAIAIFWDARCAISLRSNFLANGDFFCDQNGGNRLPLPNSLRCPSLRWKSPANGDAGFWCTQELLRFAVEEKGAVQFDGNLRKGPEDPKILPCKTQGCYAYKANTAVISKDSMHAKAKLAFMSEIWCMQRFKKL